MKHIFITLMLLSAAALGGVATAQTEAQNQTDIPEVQEDASVDLTATDLNIQLDEDVTITGFEYGSDEAFRIKFQVEEVTRVTLSASTQRAEGAGKFAIKRERLLPGENEVTIPVARSAGESAVSITTGKSIANGEGAYVSTGMAQVNRPPVEWQSAQLLIILSAVGSGAGAIRYVARKRDDETKEAEQIL